MRTRRLLGVALASVALVAACSDDATRSTTTTAADGGDSGEPPLLNDGGSQYFATDDYVGPELPLLASRTTDSGIRLWIREFDWRNMSVPAPSGAGWEAPGWCYPVSEYRLAVVNGDAVGVLIGSRYTELYDGLSATVFNVGSADGRPTRVIVLQLDPSITEVSVTWHDGVQDTTAPTDGWALLAADGDAGDAFDLTLDGPDGARTVADADLMTGGSVIWQQQCTQPVAVLPAAGEQPADVPAAMQVISDRFMHLWDDVPFAAKGSDLLDDITGVADAIAMLPTAQYSDSAVASQHNLRGMVFVSPTEAWFQYDVIAQTTSFVNRFGVARLVDGTWKFDRAVLCQDLALLGAVCTPPVAEMVPPVG